MVAKSSSEFGPISTQGPGTNYLRPEVRDLKIVGVEEHAVFPKLIESVSAEGMGAHAKAVWGMSFGHAGMAYSSGRTTNTGAQRIKDMDEGGISMQVLSLAGPVNSTHFEPQAALAMAREINNGLKKAVDDHPDRFRSFAELPMHAPKLAIEELRRTVLELGFVGAMLSGSIGSTGKFLDDPEFDELLSEFEALDVPLFLHPGVAPPEVIDTYYTFPGKPLLTSTMAGMGWGWHNEVAIHVLRLAVSGTLDRHPKLKLIIGHQGEMLPMMVQRFDAMFDEKVFGLKRSVGETLRSQVWLAISGLFTLPPTLCSIQTWGVDRILFANDYPFIDSQRVPQFVRALGDVVAPSDLRKICQTNAEELFKFRA